MIKHNVVYTAGTWDLFHEGHLNILQGAKNLGQFLIVGVSTDTLIKRYKGIKPIVPFKGRKRIIENLRIVDRVVKQSSFFDVNQLLKYHIDLIVLGDDWRGKRFEELDTAIKVIGCGFKYLPYTKSLSSSKIKEKIIKNSYEIIKVSVTR